MKKKLVSMALASGLALTGVFGSVPSVYADTNVGYVKEVKAAVVTGQVTINNVVCDYKEVRYGTGAGNRGITFSPKTGGAYEYRISPNPHSNPAYNKDPEKFYKQIATGVKKKIESNGTTLTWSDKYTEIDGLGVDYNLELQ